MAMFDSGMPKPSTKENQIRNSTCTLSLKKKSTFKQKIKLQHTLTGFKFKAIIGLFKMLLAPYGSIILKVTKETWF
jgi:hypothetical protein